jgi:hypothetical protein
MLTVTLKCFLEETFGQWKLIDHSLYWEALISCLFCTHLESQNRLDIANSVSTDLFFENDGDSKGQHCEACPQILSVMKTILAIGHNTLHGASNLSNCKFDHMHCIQSLRSLVQRLEIFDILHAVVLKNFSQEQEVFRVRF